MSNCHCCCQENIDDDDEAMVAEKPIRDGLPIHSSVAQGLKLDALIKEEILRNKEQSTTFAEKPITDGLLITTVAATTVGIFFSLRAMGMVQNVALITSTSLALLMSLLVLKG